jgi:simple sugar transport system ATP-binding protein
MAARNAGTAILLLSEDLDEILELSDRIVVMRQGSIVYETSGAGSDARAIGGYMVGRV